MTVPYRPEPTPQAVETTFQLETAPRMMLEICRGRTRFPQRPITGPRFFIGSGPGCDLQLGGPDFPAIHSLIQIRENGIWFETLAPTPEVRINGEQTHGEWLRDGDTIEIGVFQFLAHLLPMLPPVAIGGGGKQRAAEMLTNPYQSPENLADLSASELADRLESEMDLVEQYERGRHAGAEALLHVLKQRQVNSAQHVTPRTQSNPWTVPAASATQAAQREFQLDLDRLCKDLEQLTSTLERRSETISKREMQFASAAESLLETQRQLVDQLEIALEHAAQLSEMREAPRKPSIRVSA